MAEGEADWEDRLNQVMQSRGRQPNLSFFAFTATPKGKTLELFGQDRRKRQARAVSHLQHAPGDRGGLHPGRADATTRPTPTYYKLLKAAEDDPKLPKKKGGAGAGQIHQPASVQHRAEDGSHGGAFPAQREAPAGRTSQGDGGDLLPAACRSLQAGI